MERKAIEQQLAKVERQIRDVQARMPAHSIKPPIMMELLALEDERDRLKAQLERLTP